MMALVVTAGVVLTACGGSSESASGGGTERRAGGGGPNVLADAGQGSLGAGGAGGAAAGALQVQVGRSVVRTAEITVTVADVRRAADRSQEVVRAAGGTLESEEAAGADQGAFATLRLRVPPARLEEMVNAIAALGKELQRRVGTEDVTEQVVDLDSRLATSRASVNRVRRLLSRAEDLGDVVNLEGELAKREAELESLQARARALSGQVEMATLEVRLRRATAAATDDGPVDFADGLSAGWRALKGVGRVLAVTLGALLPFTPLLLLAVPLRWWLRSRRPAEPSATP